MLTGSNQMDITTLENWLWDAAWSIRGPLDASKLVSKTISDWKGITCNWETCWLRVEGKSEGAG